LIASNGKFNLVILNNKGKILGYNTGKSGNKEGFRDGLIQRLRTWLTLL